jgi:hypothetical protein
MPYREPHHASRARISDFEVMRLELRSTARARAIRTSSGRGTTVQFAQDHTSTPEPRVA